MGDARLSSIAVVRLDNMDRHRLSRTISLARRFLVFVDSGHDSRSEEDSGSVNSLCVLPDGRLAAGSADNRSARGMLYRQGNWHSSRPPGCSYCTLRPE